MVEEKWNMRGVLQAVVEQSMMRQVRGSTLAFGDLVDHFSKLWCDVDCNQ